MKVGNSNKSMQRSFLHLKQSIDKKVNIRGGYTGTKKMSASQDFVMCPWASTTAWLRHLTLSTSRLIVSWGLAALGSLRFWGPELRPSTRRLSWWRVFCGIQVWRKYGPLHVRYLNRQQPFPDDATWMSWTIVIREEVIRLVSLMQRLNWKRLD